MRVMKCDIFRKEKKEDFQQHSYRLYRAGYVYNNI